MQKMKKYSSKLSHGKLVASLNVSHYNFSSED